MLVLCAGNLLAGSPKRVKADRYGVRESASAELLSKKRQYGVKLTFKCRITRVDNEYTLLANILKNDSAIVVAYPGVKFELANGDIVVLKAERPLACCSSWADGRWYNASFKLNAGDVAKLMYTDILSVTIPFYGGEISRRTASGKENAIVELMQSLQGD